MRYNNFFNSKSEDYLIFKGVLLSQHRRQLRAAAANNNNYRESLTRGNIFLNFFISMIKNADILVFSLKNIFEKLFSYSKVNLFIRYWYLYGNE